MMGDTVFWGVGPLIIILRQLSLLLWESLVLHRFPIIGLLRVSWRELQRKLKGEKRRKAALRWRETFPDNEAVQPVGKDEHFIPFICSIEAAGIDQGKILGEWDLNGTTMTSYVW
jgi:hypothetical protein